MLLGDTVTKVCASPRDFTWFMHQTVSPRERAGSGDKTNSGDARLELSQPNVCWI